MVSEKFCTDTMPGGSHWKNKTCGSSMEQLSANNIQGPVT